MPDRDEQSPSLASVCLDFDGTILAYEDGEGYFAPEVIGILNELEARGIAWCSNSGRMIDDQKVILARARADGLSHEPRALMCGESFLFVPQDGDYIPVDSWNFHVCSLLPDLHRRVQCRIQDQVEDWARRYQAECVEMRRMGTAFLVNPSESCAGRLRSELAAAVDGMEDVLVNRNAGWIFISHPELGKGAVLRSCAERMGWDRKDVLAVGDNHNDIDMMDARSAGMVGCPANAEREVADAVRANGGYVADAEGPAGSVEVIRHFLAVAARP